MKVRDLIRDTAWLPGRTQTTSPPQVTVLLPSYPRKDDHFFQDAIQSVLNQTLRDLELIIIDDASPEPTDGYLERLMQTDARVSCLRHRANIGLPAISEFEGFLRARGHYVAFGFDDFIFKPNALMDLVTIAKDAPNSVVHGFVEWLDLAGRVHYYGKDAPPEEQLKFYNFLANASFLVPRSILQDVGLFDPHIAASRLCDWDLWRRIRRKYPIIRVPVLVGREYGTTRDDSLGHTYPLIEEAMQEYFGLDRDIALRPENFPAFDVWQLSERASPLLTAHVVGLRTFFQKSRSWASGLEIAKGAPSIAAQTARTIGIYGPLSLTSSLIFDALPKRTEYSLLYISPDRDDKYLNCCLANCSALLVASHPSDERCEYIRRICSLLETPIYHLIDVILSLGSGQANESVAFKNDEMESLARNFDGILCSSEVMGRVIQKHCPTDYIHEVGFVMDADKRSKFCLLNAEGHGDLRLGVLGGNPASEKMKGLSAAVERVGQRIALRLLTSPEIDWRNPALPITLIDDESLTDDFLIHWRQHKPDIITAFPQQELSLWNTSAILLVACYLRSIPILPELNVFYGLGEREGVLRTDGSSESYENAILRVSDPRMRARLLQSLDEYCDTRFTPERTHLALAGIANNCRPLDATDVISRLRALVIDSSDRALLAESRVVSIERDYSLLVAAKDLELQSKSYQLALKIRRWANYLRIALKRLGMI